MSETSRFRDGSRFESIAGYSRAAKRGPAIAVSGTAALDADGAAVSPGDTYGQTREALATALDAVEQLGGSLQDVIRTRVFLTPDADWREAARAHGEQFRGADPASTMLTVYAFPPDGVLVEVEVDAILEASADPRP